LLACERLHNLVDDNQNNLFNQVSDYVGSVDRVVTSIADTFNATPDVARLSLREAIHLANNSASSNTEIWLPAWTFRLTRAGQGGVGVGTIDISTSISLRGISQALTTVDARHIMDEAFVLIGDANHGGAVTGGDFIAIANNFGLVSGLDGILHQLTEDGKAWHEAGKLKTALFFHRLLPAGKEKLLVVGGASFSAWSTFVLLPFVEISMIGYAAYAISGLARSAQCPIWISVLTKSNDVYRPGCRRLFPLRKFLRETRRASP